MAHLVDGVVHGRDDRRRQRFGDVTDSQSNHVGVGVGLDERVDPATDFGKEVAGLELQIVVVELGHRGVLGRADLD